MTKKRILLLSAIVCIFGVTGCGNSSLKNGEEVVATINGEKFTADELYEKLVSQSGSTTLINMVDEYILNKEYETDEDAKTYAESNLESYKSSYESYGQDFDEALEEAGYADEDAFKETLILEYKKNLVAESYVKDQITDDEIQTYYNDNIYGDIEARHILISPETDDDMTDEEVEAAEKKAKQKAEKIIKELDEGADFAKLAKKYSDDEGTAKNGGKMTVTYGDVVDEFWEGASELKDKTYSSEPVKSEYGYHIIYRISQKSKPKLSEVKETIIDKLVDEKLEEDSTLQTKAMIAKRKEYKLNIKDSTIKKAYNKTIESSEKSSS